jgi:hypothetical protein
MLDVFASPWYRFVGADWSGARCLGRSDAVPPRSCYK